MSRKYKIIFVDAFTSEPLRGNPCPVIFGADSLTNDEMLALAKETNQAETAFILKSENCDLKARYFTPEREIPLAGHPTIATFHAALEEGMIVLHSSDALKPRSKRFRLELNEGPIDVEIDTSSGSPLIRMFQRKPLFLETHDPELVLPLFGLLKEDLLPGALIQTVSTGTRQLMVPVRSLESLKKMILNVPAYIQYREKMNFFSPHLFCTSGVTKEGATFARHPGVAPDTAEDSFTGSATGGMAAFLWKYGFLESPKFIAEQGHWMHRPGKAEVEVIGPRDDISGVSVAGNAVSIIRGELTLPWNKM